MAHVRLVNGHDEHGLRASRGNVDQEDGNAEWRLCSRAVVLDDGERCIGGGTPAALPGGGGNGGAWGAPGGGGGVKGVVGGPIIRLRWRHGLGRVRLVVRLLALRETAPPGRTAGAAVTGGGVGKAEAWRLHSGSGPYCSRRQCLADAGEAEGESH